MSEAPITKQELLASEAAWLINSLGCRLISHLDQAPLAQQRC